MTHTKEPFAEDVPELTKDEITSRVDELTQKLIDAERRSLVCTIALAGVEDPEAFMRDLREYFDGRIHATSDDMNIYEKCSRILKGGE